MKEMSGNTWIVIFKTLPWTTKQLLVTFKRDRSIFHNYLFTLFRDFFKNYILLPAVFFNKIMELLAFSKVQEWKKERKYKKATNCERPRIKKYCYFFWNFAFLLSDCKMVNSSDPYRSLCIYLSTLLVLSLANNVLILNAASYELE